jgi:hypothetical protein
VPPSISLPARRRVAKTLRAPWLRCRWAGRRRMYGWTREMEIEVCITLRGTGLEVDQGESFEEYRMKVVLHWVRRLLLTFYNNYLAFQRRMFWFRSHIRIQWNIYAHFRGHICRGSVQVSFFKSFTFIYIVESIGSSCRLTTDTRKIKWNARYLQEVNGLCRFGVIPHPGVMHWCLEGR